MRPVYEAPYNRKTEDELLVWLRPRLRRIGQRRLGDLIYDQRTRQFAPCEWLINFERGAYLIEIKHRSVQFADFMIGERKIRELQALVMRDRARGRLTDALICVSLPHDSDPRRRAVYGFTTDLEPCARRVGGRVDRGDACDTEWCLHYRWEDMTQLGSYRKG